jgi:anti-sigma B factor antagonist
MNIERTDKGAITILRLEGDIDELGMNKLRIGLMDCLHDQRYHVVVNMTKVKFVSYMGVGVLVERLRQLRTNGGDMKLAGVNLYTQRLFRMASVHKVFETYESEVQALQAYQEAA